MKNFFPQQRRVEAIMATFLDAIATADILTVSNDVKLVETLRA